MSNTNNPANGLSKVKQQPGRKHSAQTISAQRRTRSSFLGETPQSISKDDTSAYNRELENEEGGEGYDRAPSDIESAEEDDEAAAINFAEQKKNERQLFKSKIMYQRRALFRKNATLQVRQVGTNICQIFTPILGLAIILSLKYIGSSNLQALASKSIYIPIPFLFNIPYKPFSTLGQFFNISDCNQWYLYQFAENLDEQSKEFWGSNYGTPMQRPQSHGMINGKSNVMTYPCKEIDRSVPFFEDLDINNMTINQYIHDSISVMHEQQIDNADRNSYVKYSENLPDGAITVEQANVKKLRYKLQINDNRYWQYHRNNGITKIGVVDKTADKDDTRTQDGTTYMIRSTEGQIQLADMINQAYIRELFNDTHVVNGIQFMPFKPDVDSEIERIINVVGLAVFPTCLALSLPVFMYTLVLEKETKLVETMKINGMKMYNYWLVNFVFDLFLYGITVVIFWLSGIFMLGTNFFSETGVLLMITVYVGWGFCQVSLAFFFSVFMDSSQTASIMGYALSIWATTIATSMNITIYTYPEEMDWFVYPFPTFPFTRIIYLTARSCAFGGCVPSYEKAPLEMKKCIMALYAGGLFYLILALYLYQVVPQAYGVAKHPLFFLKRKGKKNFIERLIFGRNKNKDVGHEDPAMLQEDADSKAERVLVHKLDPAKYYKNPLIVKDIRKVYPGFNGRPPKVANKSICLKINRGELFGLLGPNGAGKTTLISMLTGMYKPTEGNAWMAGYDIRNQLELVQLQIGVCPQFDILWGDLTVVEHLLFYARLKGVKPEDETAMVNKALGEVQLIKEQDTVTKLLPLGMKRRLSIAISLVANPKIIFLDEPTTGLDPETRRQLWNILQECKNDKNRAMILTTHSMEEADVLCNRIGIVSNGVLNCIGSQVRLKSLYGGGYHLFVNCQRSKQLKILQNRKRQAEMRRIGFRGDNWNALDSSDEDEGINSLENTPQIIREANGGKSSINENDGEDALSVGRVHQHVIEFIHKLLPQAMLLRDFNGNFVYQIPLEGFNAERLFIEMEKHKEKLKIADWGISQCSLEDVFTRICGDV